MSYWTHIVAILEIDTCIQDKNIKEYVENKLNNAPKITGSEGCADIFINVLSGHNWYISHDCDACKYKDTIIYNENGSYICDADENYECPEGRYQTKIIISIVGNLRDRMKEQTEKEYNLFCEYIKNCEFDIDNEAVSIIGD